MGEITHTRPTAVSQTYMVFLSVQIAVGWRKDADLEDPSWDKSLPDPAISVTVPLQNFLIFFESLSLKTMSPPVVTATLWIRWHSVERFSATTLELPFDKSN